MAAPSAQADATSFLEDAAHYPGGHAAAVVRPRSVGELSAVLKAGGRILPVGAQSSLTGGATPFGDTVLSTDRLVSISIDGDRARVGAGVPLQVLQDELAKTRRWFPPVPTFLGAFAGGAVATNAAGAATFKYGSVRPWVEALTIVLAGGDVLALSRGECVAGPDAVFEIATSSGVRRFQIPGIRMPEVPKRSAGYHCAPGMDLIDLFIGSEGTLGVIADVTLRTAPLPGGVCKALVKLQSEHDAIGLVGALRAAAMDTWRSGDPNGIDIAAIEHIDRRCIELLIEDGADSKHGVSLHGSAVLLLIDVELTPAQMAADLWAQLESVRDSDADTPLIRFCRILDRWGALDEAEIALPADRSRAAALVALREAVPLGVNRRVGLAQQMHPAISKTAADMIVPFERFGDMMAECRRLFVDQDLDLAVWGHISDGNVHPNVIPHSPEDFEKGKAAILELGRSVIDMGGCPLAEHGVGRNPIKQRLLAQLYGDAGLAGMRAIKTALDPHGVLANGVIFPAPEE